MNDVVFAEGDPGDCFYVLTGGRVGAQRRHTGLTADAKLRSLLGPLLRDLQVCGCWRRHEGWRENPSEREDGC